MLSLTGALVAALTLVSSTGDGAAHSVNQTALMLIDPVHEIPRAVEEAAESAFRVTDAALTLGADVADRGTLALVERGENLGNDVLAVLKSPRSLGKVAFAATAAVAMNGIAAELEVGGGVCAGGRCGTSATCFVAGTQVAACDGEVPIEGIVPGQRIRTLNEAACSEGAVDLVAIRLRLSGELTGEATILRSRFWLASMALTVGTVFAFDSPELGTATATVAGVSDVHVEAGLGCVVTGTVRHDASVIVELALGTGELLETTPLHPFWVEDVGAFVRAGDLRPGLLLRTGDGHEASVASVRQRPTGVDVYNLEIDGAHTYLVGEDWVWVHNACARGLWRITEERTSRVVEHSKFGKFYKSKSDGLWWARDNAGHGGSAWKVFTESPRGLDWKADADVFGDFISGKHKGPTGMYVPWSHLKGG